MLSGVSPWVMSLVRNLARKDVVGGALDDELRASVDLLTEEKLEAGHPPAEARRLALVELGGVEQVKERVRQGLVPALAGVAIGLGISFGVTRTLRSLLTGVSPTDPVSFVVMTGVLLAAALLACYLRARRAGRVDPLVALHHE